MYVPVFLVIIYDVYCFQRQRRLTTMLLACISYCLVPAPFGSCPEDDFISNHEGEGGGGSSIASNFGSTHGRDPSGRRLIPVLLKDVAGLVPGAFMGKVSLAVVRQAHYCMHCILGHSRL